MNVELQVVEGRPLGAVVPIKVSPYIIGRDPGCQLRPKNPAVSGRHSAIHLRAGQVVVEDLGSTNGTLVNDHCLHAGEEMAVTNGDRLQVGQLIFVVRIADKTPGIENSVQEWLGAAEAGDDEDQNSRTLLLSALSQTGRTGHGSGIRPAAVDATPVKFVYQEFDQEHGVLCVGLSQAQMNGEGSGAIHRPLFALAANPRNRRMVLDLGDVDSLPVGAYAMLRALAQRAKEAGGKVRLCSLSPPVERMINSLRLDGMLECFEDRYEAVAEPWD